jgi:hypothetical protein
MEQRHKVHLSQPVDLPVAWTGESGSTPIDSLRKFQSASHPASGSPVQSTSKAQNANNRERELGPFPRSTNQSKARGVISTSLWLSFLSEPPGLGRHRWHCPIAKCLAGAEAAARKEREEHMSNSMRQKHLFGLN